MTIRGSLLLLPLLGATSTGGGLIGAVEEGPLTPVPLYHAAMVSDGEWVYIVGGQDDDRTEEGQFYSAAWQMKPDTNEWVSLPPYPFPIAGARAALLDRVLYVVGGALPSEGLSTWGEGEAARSARSVAHTWGSTPYAANILATVRRLDLDALDAGWQEVAYLNYPRTDFGLAVVDGRLLAVGGNYYPADVSLDGGTCDVDPDTGRIIHCLPLRAESYDPALDTWTLDADVLVSRNQPGIAVLEDVAIVAGGFTFGTTESAVPGAADLAERYDVGTFTFTPTPPPEAVGRAEGAGLAGSTWFLSESFNLPGGTTTPTRLFGYDPARDRWVYADLDFARVLPGLVAVGDELWVIGGYTMAPDADGNLQPRSMGTPLPMLRLSLQLGPTVEGGCGGSVHVLSEDEEK